MVNKKIMKTITVCFAIAWILLFCYYASTIMGTLAHELKHKSYSYDPVAITVNYDGSGQFQGATFRHSHEWVYFNGYMVEMALFLISCIALIICIEYGIRGV